MSALQEFLEVREKYHSLEEWERPLFIVKWLDKRVSELEKREVGNDQNGDSIAQLQRAQQSRDLPDGWMQIKTSFYRELLAEASRRAASFSGVDERSQV